MVRPKRRIICEMILLRAEGRMMWLRVGAVVVLSLIGAFGCDVSGPRRASDIQNLNAINDDISAVTMTESDTRRARDPNIHSTLPRNYETFDR